MKDKIREIIRELRRCVKQNESDARMNYVWYDYSEGHQARAVANEQRRMIKILKGLLK